MGERKMQNSLWSTSATKLTSLIQQDYLLIAFFDGAENNKKNCYLVWKDPRVVSFHGVDHVLPLFLSDLAKKHSIPVSEKLYWSIFMNMQHFLINWFSKLADLIIFLVVEPIMQSMQYSWIKQQESTATEGLAYWGEQVPGLPYGFTLCTNFWAKQGHWKLQFTPQTFQVLLTIPVLFCPFKILKMKSSGRQFTVF